jgi:hypothetical protein
MSQTGYVLDAQASLPSKVNFSIRPPERVTSDAYATSYPAKTVNKLTFTSN